MSKRRSAPSEPPKGEPPEVEEEGSEEPTDPGADLALGAVDPGLPVGEDEEAPIDAESEWLDDAPVIHHYRDKDQDEVDIVVEKPDGAIVGIEVKAAASVGAGDFRGLRKLAGTCGDEFKLGVVLYDGDQVVPFGERLYAAPVSCLWA